MSAVDLRCPADPRRLFGRLGGARIGADNTIEFVCGDCRKVYRRNGDDRVVRVLHTFNMLGECIDTEVLRGDP